MKGAGDPWYADGLRFSCTQCGECCTGDPGYVWVTRREIEDLAAHLNVPTRKFEQRYVRQIGKRSSLRELANGDCVFFERESRHCSVYPVRPAQCRSWPFWKENLKSPHTWAEACVLCPGSGQGRLYTLDEIHGFLDSGEDPE